MAKTKSDKRTVLITGVSRGLGRAMTAEFIERGHIVIGCARSESRIAELRKTFGDPHDFHAVDVANAGQVQAWADGLLSRQLIPSLVLNNAAIINRNAPLWEIPPDEFSSVIDVNIKGVANVIRAFAPAMIQRGEGLFINFSSGWGRSTDADVAPYCATKWAIEGLSKAFAQELPRGLASIPMNPGIIDTEMLRSCFGGGAAGFPDAERWAKVAVPYFLSLGPGHNGQSLTVPL